MTDPHLNDKEIPPRFVPDLPDGWTGRGWRCIGEAGVDSAQLAVQDPKFPDMGVTFWCGLGDGGYWVWVYEAESKEDGLRNAAVFVHMMEKEDAT